MAPSEMRLRNEARDTRARVQRDQEARLTNLLDGKLSNVCDCCSRLIERVFHETGRGTNGAQTPGNKHGEAQNARQSGISQRFLRDVRVLPTADSPADARCSTSTCGPSRSTRSRLTTR